ncbi:hypothetical protein AB0K15_47805 [Amycolatopsis sp. NPDC049253]|uniref:hypothetical protein n=1 Tax=Amycolatopsis sp. NPDC049253 TaxID=3155274 RepID=UPI00342E3DE5
MYRFCEHSNKVRYYDDVDALVLGVTGSPSRPTALVLGQADRQGRVREVGLSTTLSRSALTPLAGKLRLAEGGPQRASGIIAGLPGSEVFSFWPVEPGVVVEARADRAFERSPERPCPHRALHLRRGPPVAGPARRRRGHEHRAESAPAVCLVHAHLLDHAPLVDTAQARVDVADHLVPEASSICPTPAGAGCGRATSTRCAGGGGGSCSSRR